MQGDNRDPDENEGNHAPAESQAPERALDCSTGWGSKGHEGPDQDHLEKKVPQKFYKSEVELRMTVFGLATLE